MHADGTVLAALNSSRGILLTLLVSIPTPFSTSACVEFVRLLQHAHPGLYALGV